MLSHIRLPRLKDKLEGKEVEKPKAKKTGKVKALIGKVLAKKK